MTRWGPSTWSLLSVPLRPVACIVALTTSAMAGEPAAIGSLSVTPSDGGLRISAHVIGQAPSPTTLETTLEVLRADTNGSVSTRQAKTVEITAGQTEEVAQTNVSFAPVGTLDITFVIRHSGSVIHRVSHRVVNAQPD